MAPTNRPAQASLGLAVFLILLGFGLFMMVLVPPVAESVTVPIAGFFAHLWGVLVELVPG